MIRLSQTKGPVSSGRATLSSSGSGKARLDTNGKCKILGGYPWHQSRSARGEDSASSMGARGYELADSLSKSPEAWKTFMLYLQRKSWVLKFNDSFISARKQKL